MSKLRKWETPFASASWPSVSISVDHELRRAVIYVDAEQLWQIHFDFIAGVKVCDESYDDNTRFHIDRDVDGLCSYFWDDSPWLKRFNSEMAEVCEVGKLAHHVLLGGDYNIEILAMGDAKYVPIERRADNGE